MTAVAVTGGTLDFVKSMGTIDTVTKITSVGSAAGTPGVHIAALPCPTVNNAGVTGSWSWRTAAATAVALLSTAAAYEMADMQYQTAKRYWQLARERWDYFLNTYKPCEQKEVVEACTAPIPVPKYKAVQKAYTTGVQLAFDHATADIMQLSALYCVCPDMSLAKDVDLMRSQFIGDGISYAMRREEAMSEALDDLRWNRKIGVLNRGRGLLAQSASFARTASDMYDQYGKSMSAVASGATEFLGYSLNRNPTDYPERQVMNGGYAGYSVPPQSSIDGVEQIIQNSTQQPAQYPDPSGSYTDQVSTPSSGIQR